MLNPGEQPLRTHPASLVGAPQSGKESGGGCSGPRPQGGPALGPRDASSGTGRARARVWHPQTAGVRLTGIPG